MASYKQGGEQKRWRGAEADFPGALPADATDVEAVRTDSRTETFVTLGEPTDLTPTGKGLELAPVTHPNDLAAGEAATFKLLKDGQPAADVEVTIARGGTRYRNNPEEITVKTGADGAFSVTWPEAGLYWLGASVRTAGVNGQPGSNASWNGALEVLP
ncbi:Nickel uptake substrate-specific transmembrane region [compost metagenome]